MIMIKRLTSMIKLKYLLILTKTWMMRWLQNLLMSSSMLIDSITSLGLSGLQSINQSSTPSWKILLKIRAIARTLFSLSIPVIRLSIGTVDCFTKGLSHLPLLPWQLHLWCLVRTLCLCRVPLRNNISRMQMLKLSFPITPRWMRKTKQSVTKRNNRMLQLHWPGTSISILMWLNKRIWTMSL